MYHFIGGCLDPPFGEDKEPYRKPIPRVYRKPVSKVKGNKEVQNISASTEEPSQSSKTPSKLVEKETNNDKMEPKPVLNIYARPVSSKPSSTSSYSDATIRHASKMSSSKLLDSGKNNSKTYDDDSIRQSYQYPETYFIPPRDMLQHKEEERRYSRERSNDQISPTTTRRENEHETSTIPHIFDVSNNNYPENVDPRHPHNTKLSKQKGKENSERIKQTLTDLTSNEIDNVSKASEGCRENEKKTLNVPLVAQKVETTSSYKETPLTNITYIQNLDDFDIPITGDDLDLSIISKYNQDESIMPEEKYSKQHENVIQTKNTETTKIDLRAKFITDELYEPENKYLPKDMRNKNVLKNDEPIKSEKIVNAMPESVKLEDFNINSTLVIGQRDVKALQSVPSLATPKFDTTCDLNGTLEDKLTKTSDQIEQDTDSQLPPNLAQNQTKLLMTVGLPSLENILDVDFAKEKNNDTSGPEFNHYKEHAKDTNFCSDSVKSVDGIQNLSSLNIYPEPINKDQELEHNKPSNDNPNPLASELDVDKINKSVRTSEIRKKQIIIPDVLVSESDTDSKLNKYLRTDLMPQKQINENKNIQEEQVKHSKINHQFQSNMVQNDTFNDVLKIKNDEGTSLQDVESKTHSDKFDNLAVAEAHDKTVEEKLGDLKISNIPSDRGQVKNKLQSNTDIISNQNQRSSENFNKRVLDERCRNSDENVNMCIMPNTITKTDLDTFSSAPINKRATNIPDMKDVNVENEVAYDAVKIRKSNDKSNITHEKIEENVKPKEHSKYTKNKEYDTNITDIENALDSDNTRQPSSSSPCDSDHVKSQPMDTSAINVKKSSEQNLSHGSILESDTEFSPSSANSIETNNLNYYDKEKGSLNHNCADSNNVIIKGASLHDRTKNLTLDNLTIPSAILQKPPLVKTEDADLRNDEINVIKPFKRNTFTIVASSTSIEKQDEPISFQQTNQNENEQPEVKKDKKNTSNEQIAPESQFYTLNDQKKNNEFIADSEQKAIKTNSFIDVNKHSETSVKTNILRGNYEEMANQIKYPGSPANQKANNIKIMSNTTSDNKLRTNNYEKSNLALETDSNYIDVVADEIPKSQGQIDNKVNDNENLTLSIVPDHLMKQIAELQDRPDVDFEHLQAESKTHSNEKKSNSVLNDTMADNTIKQMARLLSQEYTDDLSNDKISLSNISEVEAGSISITELTNDIEKSKTHEEDAAIVSNEKLNKNYSHIAMKHESKLLEISKGEDSHEVRELKYTPAYNSQTIIGGKPKEYESKLVSDESSRKIVHANEEFDTQSIHGNDQRAIMDEENDNLEQKKYWNEIENANKYIDKKSITPADYTTRHYVENEFDSGNISKILYSETMGISIKNIGKESLDSKDDTKYNREYNKDTKSDSDRDVKNTLEIISVENFNKHIDTTSILSKEVIEYYNEYNSLIENSENDDLGKIKEPVSVGKFNEVIEENPLVTKYDSADDFQHDTISTTDSNGVLEQQFNAVALENSHKVNGETLFASKDGFEYSNEAAPLLKASILIDNLSNISQVGGKIHTEHRASTVTEQQLGIEAKEIVYNQNEDKLNKTDHNGKKSNPIHKTNSEVLFLNLALQSYVNDKNHTVMQTISPLVEPVRYADDNITVVQSLIRHGHEIRIPVDVENDLSLKFITKTHQISQSFNADQNTSNKERIMRNRKFTLIKFTNT